MFGRRRGPWAPLFTIVGVTLVVANFGSGMARTSGGPTAVRDGQKNALPSSFFARLTRSTKCRGNNVIFVGALALFGFVLSYLRRGIELLNFGALIAFMGVNAAHLCAISCMRSRKRRGIYPPVLGFVICLALWLSLSRPAQIVGSIWMIAGIAFGIWKTGKSLIVSNGSSGSAGNVRQTTVDDPGTQSSAHLQNAKTVVRTNHLAEGTTFVERVGGNTHGRSKRTVL